MKEKTVIVDTIRKFMPRSLFVLLRKLFRSGASIVRGAMVRDGIVTLHGIRLDLKHPLVTPRIRDHILRGSYESQEARIIGRYLRPDDTVLELGSGMGFVTMLVARIVGEASVFTFEANPRLEPLLRRNFSLNGMNPNLQIAVLGEGTGTERLFLEADFFSSSSFRQGADSHVDVPRRDFATAVRELKPTVLVMDIEGGEAAIVNLLEGVGIRLVIIECHPTIIGEAETERMIARLESLGFETERHGTEETLFQYVGVRV